MAMLKPKCMVSHVAQDDVSGDFNKRRTSHLTANMVASVPRPRAVNSNPLQILSSRLLCSGKYSSNDGYNTQQAQ